MKHKFKTRLLTAGILLAMLFVLPACGKSSDFPKHRPTPTPIVNPEPAEEPDPVEEPTEEPAEKPDEESTTGSTTSPTQDPSINVWVIINQPPSPDPAPAKRDTPDSSDTPDTPDTSDTPDESKPEEPEEPDEPNESKREEPDEPKPEEPDDPKLEEPDEPEQLVTDAYASDEDPVWMEKYGSDPELSFHIPQICLPGEEIERINREIYEENHKLAFREDYRGHLGYRYIRYSWTVREDILSLRIEGYTLSPVPDEVYRVYNICISQAREATREEILAAAGLSEEEYVRKLREAAGSYYLDLWERENAPQDDFYWQQFERTVSDGNLDAAAPYFSEDGHLMVNIKVYSLVAADYYWTLLDLDDYTLSAGYADALKKIGLAPDEPAPDIVPDPGRDDDSKRNDEPVPVPDTDRLSLGDGNLANGGLATGNKTFTFYVVREGKSGFTLYREENSSGNTVKLCSAQYVDCLNLSGDTLFFRACSDKEYRIMTVRNGSDQAETLYAGTDGIFTLTLYRDRLYFTEGCNLVRCDLDGSNRTVLYEGREIGIPFCAVRNRIYYSEPTVRANGGMMFGNLCSMDLDGGSRTELLSSEIVWNEFLFSDGEWLYFIGNGSDFAGGFLRCRLDGSNLTTLNVFGGCSYNVLNGKVYCSSASSGLSVLDEELNWIPVLSGEIEEFSIVNGWVYYTETNYQAYASGYATKRASLSGAGEVLLP